MASHEKNKISEHDFPGNFFEIETSYFMCHVVLRLDPWFLSCSKQKNYTCSINPLKTLGCVITCKLTAFLSFLFFFC